MDQPQKILALILPISIDSITLYPRYKIPESQRSEFKNRMENYGKLRKKNILEFEITILKNS